MSRGTQAEFAKKYGYSRAAVTQLKNAGRLVFNSDGTINFDESAANIGATSKNKNAKEFDFIEANQGGQSSIKTEYGALTKARLVKEKYLAMQAKLEYDAAVGNLIVRDDVHKSAFESGRKLRDNLHSLCKQSAPNLVNIDDPSKIEMYLKDEIDAALKEFIDSCAL